MGRLEKLRNMLEKENMDALLVTSSVNIRYMTGFTGTAGMAIISQNHSYFITDFRYIEQANTEVGAFKIKEHKGPIQQKIAEILKELDVRTVGFEKNDVSYGQYEVFKEVIEAELVPTAGLMEQLRMIKDEKEIDIIKEACKIADNAFHHILDYIKPGAKEIDIANELEFYMRKEGATSSSFDIIVASGYRSALPHGVASNKEIQAGELVTLDFGALYKGYSSDITRTVAVGNISKELQAIYKTVLEAQMKSIENIKAGTTSKEADAYARDLIKEAGYGSYFGHATGHGLGLDVHEQPSISFRSDKELKKGMVVTVEPGIYIPDVGGCRIEDDILIEENGNQNLTAASKELIHLPLS